MIVTYSEYVFVALGIQHAMRMRRVVTYGLPGSTIFLTLLKKTARFSKEKFFEHKLNIKHVF